jgi:hypothetical protein
MDHHFSECLPVEKFPTFASGQQDRRGCPTLLSELLAHKESRGDTQGAALVKQASPVAWQHVNLYGRYEFRKQPEPVDVHEIVRELAEIRIGTEIALAA